MLVLYTLGTAAYLYCGYQFLMLDYFAGDIHKYLPPILIILLWFPFVITFFLTNFWNQWFTIKK